MGQRLVVTVETNERELCKLYYHWSAYTLSALWETKQVIDCIYDHEGAESESELILRLIHFCENKGGCIDGGRDSTEGRYIQRRYPEDTFKETGDRSDGLIAISDPGMLKMQLMSEGDVVVNIDAGTVNFCVYGAYESLDEYIEERELWRELWDDELDEEELCNIPTFNFNLGHFKIEDIDAVLTAVDSNSERTVIQCMGEICELIRG